MKNQISISRKKNLFQFLICQLIILKSQLVNRSINQFPVYTHFFRFITCPLGEHRAVMQLSQVLICLFDRIKILNNNTFTAKFCILKSFCLPIGSIANYRKVRNRFFSFSVILPTPLYYCYLNLQI